MYLSAERKTSFCKNSSSTADGVIFEAIHIKALEHYIVHAVRVDCLKFNHLQLQFTIGGPFNNYLDFLSPSDIAVSFLPIILYLIDPAELL